MRAPRPSWPLHSGCVPAGPRTPATPSSGWMAPSAPSSLTSARSSGSARRCPGGTRRPPRWPRSPSPKSRYVWAVSGPLRGGRAGQLASPGWTSSGHSGKRLASSAWQVGRSQPTLLEGKPARRCLSQLLEMLQCWACLRGRPGPWRHPYKGLEQQSRARPVCQMLRLCGASPQPLCERV